MKTIIAATLVLFSVSTSAVAFEMPSIDGLDGVQQMMQGKGKGKRSQRSQQQQGGEEGQSRQASPQDSIKGLMNGDTSGLQGMMSSFGR